MASVAAYVARPLPPAAAVATVPVTGIISGPSSSCGAAAATVAASTSSVTPSAPPPSMPSPLVATGSGGGKDSRWLTLEVCREHVRRRCTRSDDECRFAHPPPHVEVQNGRVVCCFDSIKVDVPALLSPLSVGFGKRLRSASYQNANPATEP